MSYYVTPEDRAMIALIPTEELFAVVSTQLVPEIVAIMVDELNFRYTILEDQEVVQEFGETAEDFDAALNDLLYELSFSVEEFEDEDFYGTDFGDNDRWGDADYWS